MNRKTTVAVAAVSLLLSCSTDPDPSVGNNDLEDASSAETDASDGRDDAGNPDTAGDTSERQDDVGGEDAGSDGGSEDAGGVPLIQNAELCELPPNPRVSVNPGTDLMKLTLSDPDAVCNDGSPGIIYVRPAPAGSPNADRWIVWLEGGGGCNHAAACVERWCGDHPIYSAAKMSSRFAPDGIQGNGIFRPTMANDFGDYNVVAGYYCSSDNWSGRHRKTATDESGTWPDFDVYFHGAFIVDALVDTLKAGGTSDDGNLTMPSIDDASLVVLAGTSAGGGGARFNADRVGEMLRDTNADVDYRLVVDAGAFPAEPHPPELSEEDALEILDLKYDVVTNWRDGITDESCLEHHADDPRWCAENTHLLVHHISTPWFVKMDLTDSANSPGPYEDVETFARVTHEFYSDLAADAVTPEEADVDLTSAGLFVPNCGHHVNLDVSPFSEIRITNGNVELSTHDVLSNWIAGTGPARVLHDPDSGFTSICPP